MNTIAGITNVARGADVVRRRPRRHQGQAAGHVGVRRLLGIIGTTLQIVGESLCEAVDLRAGSKVLDVAAGNGNCSLAAARRFCDVTSTDYVPALLEDGRRRAEAERPADRVPARPTPRRCRLPTAAFDVVLSSFGVMFTPNHARAAASCCASAGPGGRIGLANWTPRGFIGRLFTVVGRHVPPPPGLTPPSRWGLEDHLNDLFRAVAPRTSTRRIATSCSGIAHRNIGSRSSGTGTGPSTRRSRVCPRTRNAVSSRICWG